MPTSAAADVARVWLTWPRLTAGRSQAAVWRWRATARDSRALAALSNGRTSAAAGLWLAPPRRQQEPTGSSVGRDGFHPEPGDDLSLEKWLTAPEWLSGVRRLSLPTTAPSLTVSASTSHLPLLPPSLPLRPAGRPAAPPPPPARSGGMAAPSSCVMRRPAPSAGEWSAPGAERFWQPLTADEELTSAVLMSALI